MYVKGVGPARAAMLEAKGLKSIDDLLTYAPFRYEDRSNVKPIRELAPGERWRRCWRVRSSRFRDSSVATWASLKPRSRTHPKVLAGKWFHGGYLADVLAPGQKVALFGKVELDSYSHGLTMMHPG